MIDIHPALTLAWAWPQSLLNVHSQQCVSRVAIGINEHKQGITSYDSVDSDSFRMYRKAASGESRRAWVNCYPQERRPSAQEP